MAVIPSSPIPNWTVGSTGGGGFLGGLNRFIGSPLGQFATLAGLGGLSSLGESSRLNRQLEAEQEMLDQRLAREREIAELNAALTREQLASTERREAAGMAGESPLAHQMDRARAELLRQFLGGEFRPSVQAPEGIPQGRISFPQIAIPFLEPSARQAAERPYYQAQQSLNPELDLPDFEAIGYRPAEPAETTQLAIQQALRPGSATQRNRFRWR